MKGRRGWVLLLVIWCALLAVQLLSYIGVLPFGKVHSVLFLVGAMGVLSCLQHLFRGD